MGTGTKILAWIVSILLIFVICFSIFTSCTPMGKTMWNGYTNMMQKVDDRTLYEKQKIVEDTCRAMIASYNSDKLTYEQYKSSTNEEKQGWAEQAKMRANKTASTYNSYILQNSFIWKENVPADIYRELQFIK
jgi:hypothetical protein